MVNSDPDVQFHNGDDMKHYVHIAKPAITQILLNGFEAFVINHGNKKRNGLEMHASLYGWHEDTSRTRHHYVEFVSVDTSAVMSGGYVIPDGDAQDLKAHLAQALGYSPIGAMHTHPYLLAEQQFDLDFVRQTGCNFSAGDLQCFTSLLQQKVANGVSDPKILEVLLTIKQVERQNVQRDGFLPGSENVFEFAVGNCKCFLRAQVFSLDNQGDLVVEATALKCDYLESFKHTVADFGRVRVAEGRQRIVEHRT